MSRLVLFCILLSLNLNLCSCDKYNNDIITGNPAYDQDLSFTEIIEKYGYPVELHEIETEDGYLLDTYRIPYGAKSITKQPNMYPVILNHGLMGSAENFIIGGPKKALSYVLADHGFDVWVCNARGSWHSRKHKFLKPDNDTEFWKFTWHELGYYDLPSTIDYILKITNRPYLQYIGHSQGTTAFFVLASERPEYNKKVKLTIAMAPSAILGNIKEPSIRIMAPMYKYFQNLAESFKIYELIPNQLLSNEVVRFMGKGLCGEHTNRIELCSNILIAVAGFTQEQLDPATIPLIMGTGPAGASVYQALHYAQLVATGKFEQYNWSPNENKRRYRSLIPPEYNLKNVTSPVALMYAEADTLIAREDVEILAQILPNVVDAYKVPFEKWSHMDFVWGKDVDKYINKRVIRLLRKFRE